MFFKDILSFSSHLHCTYEKSAVILEFAFTLLCIMFHFSLSNFEIFSLSWVLRNLIMTCVNVVFIRFLELQFG